MSTREEVNTREEVIYCATTVTTGSIHEFTNFHYKKKRNEDRLIEKETIQPYIARFGIIRL